VSGITSQQFWLYWTDPEGKLVSHALDYFARRADVSAVVLDFRPVDRSKPLAALLALTGVILGGLLNIRAERRHWGMRNKSRPLLNCFVKYVGVHLQLRP
jgi:hypothetical protein